MNENYREFQLPNGLVVALQQTPTQTIAAKLRVNWGSFNEEEGEEGYAHFLEHGIWNAGSTKYSPEQSGKIAEIFTRNNASTSPDKTVYYATTLPEFLEKWLDWTADSIFNPSLDKEKIEQERERILREIADRKSRPAHLQTKELEEILFRGHPRAQFVGGKEETIQNATPENLHKFHQRGYIPNNMQIILVGNIPQETEELVKKYFEKYPGGKKTTKKFPPLQQLPEKRIFYHSAQDLINTNNPSQSSAHIMIACVVPPVEHPDHYSIRMLSTVLGHGEQSRLHQSISAKRGLAYHVDSDYNYRLNAGTIKITGAVTATRVEEAIDGIFEEIKKMQTEKTASSDINRIKLQIRYTLAALSETNSGHLDAIEAKLEYGITPEIFNEGFNAVTPEMVMEAANKYLPKDRETGLYVLGVRSPLIN